MFENKKIDIIVPCFNEEDNLDELYKRLSKVLLEINIKFNIILIDDGSKDRTWEKIKLLSEADKNVTGIKLSKNFGHQYALKAGIDFADSDYVFTLDADLQDPPELLKKMLNKMLAENLNIVYAQRAKNNENFFKKFSSYVFYSFLDKISKINIPQQVSDFRLIDKKILIELKKIDERDLFYRGLVPWMGFSAGKINFERENRKKGKTGWSLSKMIDFGLIGIFNFSNFPMRLSFFMTFLMSLIFISFVIYALYSYFTGNVVRGWTSLVLIISFFNIIMFFVLGLISEYVGRIYLEIKKRPSYIIDEKIN
ncbi:glycosyltransferase family 2 protein [Candidatus Pelagibacter sp.]|nr:glycosyltransferase family 2 protein [Candidatus Pelagibacter sp.]